MDLKPPKRIVDPEAGLRKLSEDSTCRGCGRRASDPHHILLRSQRGDDTEDNIMPLCHLCHIAYHDGRLKTAKLTGRERLYLYTKMGDGAARAYIESHYERKES